MIYIGPIDPYLNRGPQSTLSARSDRSRSRSRSIERGGEGPAPPELSRLGPQSLYLPDLIDRDRDRDLYRGGGGGGGGGEGRGPPLSE